LQEPGGKDKCRVIDKASWFPDPTIPATTRLRNEMHKFQDVVLAEYPGEAMLMFRRLGLFFASAATDSFVTAGAVVMQAYCLKA